MIIGLGSNQTALNLQIIKFQEIGIIDHYEEWIASVILLQGF